MAATNQPLATYLPRLGIKWRISGFFATLTLLGAIAFIRLPLPLLGIMVIALGGADEIHQLFVPGRHAGLGDLGC
ncbi:MAG: VanZ family protein [Methylotenera sp.]